MSNASAERIVKFEDYIDFGPKSQARGQVAMRSAKFKLADEVQPVNDYDFIMPKEQNLRERKRARKAKHLIRLFQEAHPEVRQELGEELYAEAA